MSGTMEGAPAAATTVRRAGRARDERQAATGFIAKVADIAGGSGGV